MLQRKRDRTTTPTGYVGDHADKLSRVRPLVHDDDERPRSEDLDYGHTVFTRSPPLLPRLLRGRLKRET
jgi:hypothetical protein